MLVVGAGAAGAAVAWMLARAGVKVVCLEQGDWVDPRAFPHWRADWELHRHTDLSAEPNVRRLPQDYPVNDAGSPITPLMYNAVGGSTIHWSAHFPRFRPSDFRVRTLDGVADDWPIDYAKLEPYFDLNDRMMGVAGITGDPALSPEVAAADAADPARHARGHDGARLRSPRLALVAVRQRHPHARLRRPPRLHQLRPLRPRLPDRGEGEHRRHLLAEGAGVRRAAADARPRARDHARPGRARRRGALPRPRGAPPRAEGARGGPGRQRDRHAAAAAELALGAVSRRAGQSERPGRQEPHVPSLRAGARRLRSAARRPPRPDRLQHHQPGVLRDRSLARLRARVLVPGGPGALADRLGARRIDRQPCAVGSRAPSRLRRPLRPHDHRRGHRRGSARAGEPRRPRSRAHRRPRHPGAARVLHAEREQPAHARPWRRPRERGAGGGRRPPGRPPIPSCEPGAGT